MATKSVTDASFANDVLGSDEPVLVDFWAEWCGPCKQIGPALEDISEEFAGKLTVAKVNIDENPQIPQEYGISSIPALLVFKGGEVQERMVGLQPKSRLQEALDVAKG